METYSLDVSKEQWFDEMKNIANKHGFALNNAQFKE